MSPEGSAYVVSMSPALYQAELPRHTNEDPQLKFILSPWGVLGVDSHQCRQFFFPNDVEEGSSTDLPRNLCLHGTGSSRSFHGFATAMPLGAG